MGANPVRSKGMTAVAVLNIVFGGFGIFSWSRALITDHALLSGAPVSDDVTRTLLFHVGNDLASILIALLGLVGAVGIFKLQWWGRLFSILYAISAIGVIAIALLEPSDSFARYVQMTQNIQTTALTSGQIFAAKIVGAALAIVYPGILLIAFNRSDWKVAFAKSSSQPTYRAPAYDQRKWNALVAHDPDIARIAGILAPYDRKYTDEFASAYMSVNDKSYLPAIVQKILAIVKQDAATEVPHR